MADKGLLESARRMYGAKDAARQEAKKDMARSGEILYRGLRDFGVAKQREEAIRRTEMARQEAMDYRKQTFDQTMDFRQRQFDYTKELQNQKLEESRYLEEFGSAARVADAVSGLENPNFFPGMVATVDQYYDKLSALNEQKHNRSGDPRTIAKEYSDVAGKLSDISTEYKVMTDIINTVTKENPQSGQMDLSIFSNEPGSQEALKNITTIIKGMRDGSVDIIGDDNGKLMVRGDFNEDGNVTTTPFSELKLQEYILKNNGKGPALDALYTTAYQNGMKGFSADAGLIASQIMNMLQDYDDKASFDDFDPDFDGKNKTNFVSYYIPNLKDGTVEQGINPRWGNAQNQWWGYQIESQGWTQVDNVKRDGVNETSWEDNDGNVYVRRIFDENEGISSWTKNGKRHWWHHDDLWSGDDGIGISRKGLFAEWLGDLYAEGINNNENVKEQIDRKNNPGKGTDLGLAQARIDIRDLAEGIEDGDYSIVSGLLNAVSYRSPGDKARYSTDITTLDDGSTVSNINLRTGGSVMPHTATNYTTLSSKNQKMETLKNIISEHFAGSDLRAVLNEEKTLNSINRIFTEKETETETETTETTEIENLTLEDAKAMLKLHQDTMNREENLGANGYPTLENLNKETELKSMVDDFQDKEDAKTAENVVRVQDNKNALASAKKIIADFEKIKANDFFTPRTMNIVKRLAESSDVIIDPEKGITKEQRDKIAEDQGFDKNAMYSDVMKMFYNQFDNLLQSKKISEETREKIEKLKNSLEN